MSHCPVQVSPWCQIVVSFLPRRRLFIAKWYGVHIYLDFSRKSLFKPQKARVPLLRKRRVRIVFFGQIAFPPNSRRTRFPRLEDAVEVGAGSKTTFGGDDIIAVIGVGNHHFLGRSEADVAQPYPERSLQRLVEVYREFVFRDMDRMGEGEQVHPPHPYSPSPRTIRSAAAGSAFFDPQASARQFASPPPGRLHGPRRHEMRYQALRYQGLCQHETHG